MIKLGTVVNAPVRITQMFGDRPDYYKQFGLKGHEGMDFAANEGTIITAATKGTVTFAGDKGNNYGNYVTIWDADQNVRTLYAHLKDVTVKTGARVFEGDEIGHMGKTGNSTGVHLHFGAMRTKGDNPRLEFPMVTKIQVDEPINPNNGYGGWEDPHDDSIFDWYLGYGMSGEFIPSELGGPQSEGSTPGGTTKVPFDTIFATYYPGWGRTEAEADFSTTYGGDINRLKIARGIDDSVKKKTPKARPAALKKIYQLNPQFDGMSLKEITAGGILKGRVDILAGFLGLDEEEPLRGGQELPLDGFPTDYYPNSSEWEDYLRLTVKGKIGKKGDFYIKPEFAGMSLRDIAGQGIEVGRPDVLATFLGIPENFKIPGNQGFGTQAFPNSYIPNSSEWVGFNRIFWTIEPPDADTGQDTGQDDNDTGQDNQGTSSVPTIRVTSSPIKAKFYIDGLYFSDLTPSNKPYPVTPGVHEVRVEKAGYKDFITEVEVSDREQVIVNAELELFGTGVSGPSEMSEYGTSIAVLALIDRITKIEEALEKAKLL